MPAAMAIVLAMQESPEFEFDAHGRADGQFLRRRELDLAAASYT